MNEECNTKGIKKFSFYDSCLKKSLDLFKNIFVIDEYYYQLK
ncbi:unnamed protein product [Tenebrio molitor]|nr:unnamed protein product [Tenebrio molitor]